jgi:hypothetical protein
LRRLFTRRRGFRLLLLSGRRRTRRLAAPRRVLERLQLLLLLLGSLPGFLLVPVIPGIHVGLQVAAPGVCLRQDGAGPIQVAGGPKPPPILLAERRLPTVPFCYRCIADRATQRPRLVDNGLGCS